MPIVHECTIDISKEPFREPDTRYGFVDWAFKYTELTLFHGVDGVVNLKFISPKSKVNLCTYPRGRGDTSLGQVYEHMFVGGKCSAPGYPLTGEWLNFKVALLKGYMILEERSEMYATANSLHEAQMGHIEYDSKELTPNLYIRIDDILEFLNCDHKFSDPVPWKGGLPIIADWVQDRVGDDDIIVKRLRYLIESKVMI